MKASVHVDIVAQRTMLQELSDRVARHQRSFLADGSKASEWDRAELIAAIGWCGGWRPLFAHLQWIPTAPL